MSSKSQVTLFAIPRRAEADILDNQLVKQGTADSGVVVATGTGTEYIIGFAGENAKTGQSVRVVTAGVMSPTASGAISAGRYVTPAAAGKVAEAGSGDLVVGQAETSAVDGQQLEVRFFLPAVFTL